MKNCETCSAFDECEKCIEGFEYDKGIHRCVGSKEIPSVVIDKKPSFKKVPVSPKREKRPELPERGVQIQKIICYKGSYLFKNYCQKCP